MNRRPLLWIAALLVGGLLIGYLYRPVGTRSRQTIRSSLRTTPDGVAALARGIDRLGRAAEPRRTPFVDADPVRGTLVMLEARLSPSPREVAALLDHVRRGGALIYAPRHLDQEPGDTVQTPLMIALGIFLRPRTAEEDMHDFELTTQWTSHELAEGLAQPKPVRRAVRIGRTPEHRERVHALMAVTDIGEAEWMGAAAMRFGEGRVMVLASATGVSNRDAADDPLAALAVRAALAWTSPEDTVFFAEYHQGVAGLRSDARVLSDFLLGSPWGRTVLHLALVSLLTLACLGLRFGSPTPLVAPPDRERRSPLEHVSALGDLYRKAGASSAAGLLLVARLARAVRQPPPRTASEADALLRRLDSMEAVRTRGRGQAGAAAAPTGTPLARARAALASDPPELAALADGIDEYLTGRSPQ